MLDIVLYVSLFLCLFFFFNDTATTEIYTLSLHDALPISGDAVAVAAQDRDLTQPAALLPPEEPEDDLPGDERPEEARLLDGGDRKSTRLNSSHANISYAVFCLKKKKTEDSTNKLDRDISL